MKPNILATAALLATTLVAQLGAGTLAQANQLTEPVIKGVEVSQNSNNRGRRDKFAVMLLLAGVVVACGKAASRGSVFALGKPYSKTTDWQDIGKEKPVTIKESVKAMTLKPLDSSSYIERAYAQFKQGDINKAIEDFNEAIRVNPHSAFLYSERGNFRQKNLGDKQGAIDDYTKAIRINPRNAMFYFWRSQTHHDLGNEQRAIEDYNEAIRLAPEDTMYYCFQGTANLMQR